MARTALIDMPEHRHTGIMYTETASRTAAAAIYGGRGAHFINL